MTIEQLREVHKAQPFRPFTLELADGQRLEVPHRDFLWYSPKGGRTAFVAVGEDQVKVVDVFLVTTLTFKNGE